MEANVTALSELVTKLRHNVSALQNELKAQEEVSGELAATDGAMGDDVNTLWLIIGSILVVCKHHRQGVANAVGGPIIIDDVCLYPRIYVSFSEELEIHEESCGR